MDRYVDGFVLPLPTKNVKEYRRMAEEAGKVWLDHGALEDGIMKDLEDQTRRKAPPDFDPG